MVDSSELLKEGQRKRVINDYYELGNEHTKVNETQCVLMKFMSYLRRPKEKKILYHMTETRKCPGGRGCGRMAGKVTTQPSNLRWISKGQIGEDTNYKD